MQVSSGNMLIILLKNAKETSKVNFIFLTCLYLCLKCKIAPNHSYIISFIVGTQRNGKSNKRSPSHFTSFS